MAWAGTGSSSFAVVLQLHYRETCTSESLSERANALVQVVCQSGNFVSIAPAPGRPFPGTHGGAYRFYFPLGDGQLPLVGVHGEANAYIGYGTVTGMRVSNPKGGDDAFEVLISF